MRSVEESIALSERAIAQLQQDLREKEGRLRQAFAEAMQYIESSTIDLDAPQVHLLFLAIKVLGQKQPSFCEEVFHLCRLLDT